MVKSLITVFTPTYNRKNALLKCYESLVNQKNKNFIWQVIDDGSTDDTEMTVRKWIAEKKVNIEFIKKENGGKASAINKSLQNTNTELWMCLDSDDYLTKDAIEIIHRRYSEIKDKSSICGMFGLRFSPNGHPMQSRNIPNHIKLTTQNYIRYELKIPPEYVHVFKTDIISQYSYPIIEGENYFPLSFVFDQIDMKYKYLILQEPIMICEYRADGITKNKRKLIINNPKGYMIYKRQLIGLAPDLNTKVKAAITYNTACFLSKEKRRIRKSSDKLLTLITYPLGFIDYMLRYVLKISLDLEGENSVSSKIKNKLDKNNNSSL